MKNILSTNGKVNKKIMAVVIIVYFVILLWVIIFKCNHNDYLHIELNRMKSLADRIEDYPFQKWVRLYNEKRFSRIEIIAFLFNLICLLPFGALLRFYTDKKWLIILLGTIFSIGIEVFQVISAWGGLEYTDIVMMIFGVVLGVYIYDYLRARMSDKLINGIAIFFVTTGSPLAILTIIRTINNFPV